MYQHILKLSGNLKKKKCLILTNWQIHNSPTAETHNQSNISCTGKKLNNFTEKIKGKIIVLYILTFIFLDSKLEDKDSALNNSKHSLTASCT